MLSALVLLTAALVMIPLFGPTFRAEEVPAAPAARGSWDAVAPGRVEPRSQEIRLASPLPARIAAVLVKPNDQVFAGELLVRLDDEEALARVASADAQVALHKRARNDQSTPSGPADRRKAEDAEFDAERSLADARATLDRVTADWRAGSATREALDAARAGLGHAQDHQRELQDALARLKAGSESALPSRLESELNVARAEWSLAQAELEQTRIRAPIDAGVLQVDAKTGELAGPAMDEALVVLGDLSALRVRAELDEQYLGRMRVGQRILVRASAFPGREFEGKVSSIAGIVGPGRINARGTRKFNDVDVLEVVVDLADPGPLVVGEQVDVYFSSDREAAEMQ